MAEGLCTHEIAGRLKITENTVETSVSYTHLDVYKRQASGRLTGRLTSRSGRKLEHSDQMCIRDRYNVGNKWIISVNKWNVLFKKMDDWSAAQKQ